MNISAARSAAKGSVHAVPAHLAARDEELARWRDSPWLPGSCVNGEVRVRAMGYPEGGGDTTLRTQMTIRHDAMRIGQGATAVAFAGTLAGGTPVVVKYLRNREDFLSFRRIDTWLEHAMVRNPRIADHFLVSRAWWSSDGGIGCHRQCQGVVQDDAVAAGAALGSDFLVGVVGHQRVEVGSRLGFELARAFYNLNKKAESGEGMIHLDIKPANYAVTVGEGNLPVHVRVFDNGSILRDGSGVDKLEYANGLTDFATIRGKQRRNGHRLDVHTEVDRCELGPLADKMHAFAIAANVLHAITGEIHTDPINRIRSLSTISHEGVRTLIRGALEEDIERRIGVDALGRGLREVSADLTARRVAREKARKEAGQNGSLLARAVATVDRQIQALDGVLKRS